MPHDTHPTWTQRAAPIIAKVLADNEGADDKAVRKALRDAYPFGLRQGWPYKAWLKEIKRQMGVRPGYRCKDTPDLFDGL